MIKVRDLKIGDRLSIGTKKESAYVIYKKHKGGPWFTVKFWPIGGSCYTLTLHSKVYINV